jgi:hypothetical protein
MAYTLQQSVYWAQSMLASYIPLSAQTGSEPAITIGNMVVGFMLNQPFTWATNRNEDSSVSTVAGTQDYTNSLTNFGFLEKVTLTDAAQNSYEIQRVYNSLALGLTSQQNKRPDAVSVKAVVPGASMSVRFLSAPDAVYAVTMTYQKAPVLFTTLSQDWFTQCNIPPNQMHIYNNLFVAECFQVNGDDQTAALYRRRGMAALLATSDGLTEVQKNMMFAQATYSDLQSIAANLRAQQASQARAV